MPETPLPSRRRDLTALASRSHGRSSAQTANASARSRIHASPALSSQTTTSSDQDILVDAIFSGHSDGILVILRTTSPHQL
jgi:hypothetical protein